ncbi:hypothetical protein H920_15198 [Fukomys damarensis]|uniref:Uncharacterized protein n=1 Tax=Fukomys damarensis TaxID=885580 RepID=A0A091CYW5_FUKDA|nr:hypothetical protein H920_15198 [Fukomys damarensis]
MYPGALFEEIFCCVDGKSPEDWRWSFLEWTHKEASREEICPGMEAVGARMASKETIRSIVQQRHWTRYPFVRLQFI